MNVNRLQVFSKMFYVRWIARIIALILAILTVALLISEGTNPYRINTSEQIMLLSLLVMWTGLIFSWLWEGTGGLMIVGGGVIFYLSHLLVTGNLPGGWFLPLFFIPGILFLYYRWKTGAAV